MIRRSLIVSLVLSLAACSTAPTRPASPVALTPEAVGQLQAWTSWQAVGRLAVKSARDGFNAHFEWQQAGDRTDLLVEGPFGAGRSRVQVSPDLVRVEPGGGAAATEFGPPFSGVDAALVAQIGFAVPLHSLSYWLRGVPDPERPSLQVPNGEFLQDGWSVRREDAMTSAVLSAPLPHRLTLTRDDVRIRVVIDHWQGGRP